MKKIILLLVIVIYFTPLFAQENKQNFYLNKNEVGVNGTFLLGNLLSLTNNTNTPYSAFYCRHFKKSNLRLGADINYDDTKDFNSGLQRNLKNILYAGRLSYEFNKPISNRFMMHYGLDIIGKYESSFSTVSDFFTNEVETISVGGGPAMRIVFKLHEKIFLMTESTLYGIGGNKITTTNLNQQIDKTTSPFSSFKLTIPTSLYISIHF
jgi:hypothetical protein